jgi:beta-glucosidase
VRFDLGPAALAFHDRRMREVVEPGEFTVMVGTSSRDEDLHTLTLTVRA